MYKLNNTFLKFHFGEISIWAFDGDAITLYIKIKIVHILVTMPLNYKYKHCKLKII